jgi:hypothetical protein
MDSNVERIESRCEEGSEMQKSVWKKNVSLKLALPSMVRVRLLYSMPKSVAHILRDWT